MLKVRVKLDLPTLQRTKALATVEIRRAIARGLNRGSDTGKTTAKRVIAKATRIPQGDVSKRLWVRGANPQYLVAEIGALPYAPNLRKFSAKQNATGVAATAWERRKTYKHAFVLPSGKVVARVGQGRGPVKPLYGPSVPNTFDRNDVNEQIVSAAIAMVEKVTEYEVTRRLGK